MRSAFRMVAAFAPTVCIVIAMLAVVHAVNNTGALPPAPVSNATPRRHTRVAFSVDQYWESPEALMRRMYRRAVAVSLFMVAAMVGLDASSWATCPIYFRRPAFVSVLSIVYVALFAPVLHLIALGSVDEPAGWFAQLTRVARRIENRARPHDQAIIQRDVLRFQELRTTTTTTPARSAPSNQWRRPEP